MATLATARLPKWPLAMLLLVLALQATLVTGRAINWDEFYHYSQVERLAAGTLTEPLQSLYTRAFAWVTELPGSGIDHIVTIRWFMLACEIGILAAIVGIGSRFASRQAAWLCALAYAGAGFVFQHATSFRFDGPAAAMLMGAAWILLRSRLGPFAIAALAVLAGAATVLTIKAILYAPVFAGIAWLRWQGEETQRIALPRLAATAAATVFASAAIYWLHASTLGSAADDEARAILGRAGGKMFSLGVQPYWPHHVKGAIMAPIVTQLIAALPFVLHKDARPRAEKIALAGLALPLSTLLFYHNTAPYYFVFMLAPVCAALVVVMDKALVRYSPAMISIALAALAAGVWWVEKPGPIAKQRELLAAADQMFPAKPSYFDACAMLGSFPKANTFMTPMGIRLYQQGSYSSLTETMAKRPVPLVVTSAQFIEQAMATREPVPAFLPQDLAALREGYVHLWGPFWVAGRDFDRETAFELRVPGQYKVKDGTLLIDGKTYQSGEVIELDRGRHTALPQGVAQAGLIWADLGPVPSQPAPEPPYFTDF